MGALAKCWWESLTDTWHLVLRGYDADLGEYNPANEAHFELRDDEFRALYAVMRLELEHDRPLNGR